MGLREILLHQTLEGSPHVRVRVLVARHLQEDGSDSEMSRATLNTQRRGETRGLRELMWAV